MVSIQFRLQHQITLSFALLSLPNLGRTCAPHRRSSVVAVLGLPSLLPAGDRWPSPFTSSSVGSFGPSPDFTSYCLWSLYAPPRIIRGYPSAIRGFSASFWCYASGATLRLGHNAFGTLLYLTVHTRASDTSRFRIACTARTADSAPARTADSEPARITASDHRSGPRHCGDWFLLSSDTCFASFPFELTSLLSMLPHVLPHVCSPDFC
jgi:hypothetical protein